MVDTKLIMISGISGAGKSTTAQNLAYQYQLNHIRYYWLHEEIENHPIREGEFSIGSLHSEEDLERNMQDMFQRWEQLLRRWYRVGLQNETPTPAPVGMSRSALAELNQRIYAEHQRDPLSKVWDEFQASYLQIMTLREAIPEADGFFERNTMKTGNGLDEVVSGYWAKRFGCDPEDFLHPGTLVIKAQELVETGKMYLYHIGKMSVVRIAPSLAKQAGLPDGYDRDFGSLTAKTLQTSTGAEVESTLLDWYLDPKDFICVPPGGEFITRQLDAEVDKPCLIGLYEACTEADLEAAEVCLDEPDAVIFGVFDGTQLAAYAGQRYWEEVIADIGVLIHPDYRSRGLGKAVVSALCEWCIKNEIVPMYRVFTSHPHSCRIPEALGFKQRVVIETLKLVKEQTG